MKDNVKESNNEEIIDEEIIDEEIIDEEIDNKSKNKSIKEYEELLEKYNKVENSYQRLLADYENHKRRSALEVLEANNGGKIQVLEKILDIVDNFDRAMTFDVQTEDFKKGITMVHDMFKERLELVGLKEIDGTGELDADKHQAVAIDKIDDMEDDQIIEILQKGYCVEDKIIRPAMVKVNKK